MDSFIENPAHDFLPFEKDHIEQAISDRFEQQARRYPNKLAVKTTQESITYNQLNRLSNQIAHKILMDCGEKNDPVVLFLDQSVLLIAAILGTLKAGKIYVPLDPLDPMSRNAEKLLDSNANRILSDSTNFHQARKLAE